MSHKNSQSTKVINDPNTTHWLKDQIEGEAQYNSNLKNAFDDYKAHSISGFSNIDKSVTQKQKAD